MESTGREELSVDTLLRGLESILGYLEPKLNEAPRTVSELTLMREVLALLRSDLEAAGKLGDMCLLLARKAPPYGGPINC